MGTKNDKLYWDMHDFEIDYKPDQGGISNPNGIFLDILKKLEESFKEYHGCSINLRGFFQAKGKYVFKTDEQDNILQMDKLYEILKNWVGKDQWSFANLIKLMDYLGDLVKPFDEKDGKLVPVSEEMEAKIIALIKESVLCMIYLDIKPKGDKKIMLTMVENLKDLQNEYKNLNIKEDFGIILGFIRRFYEFVKGSEDAIDKDKRAFQEKWAKGISELLKVQRGEKEKPEGGFSVVELREIRKTIREGLEQMPKIDVKPNLKRMDEKELLQLQYHILKELSRRKSIELDDEN